VNLKIICQFHTHSVHQNSVEIFWAEIYRGRLFFSAEIYRGRLLTLITGSSSRLLRILFSADLTMYWFPVCHFRCMKFKPLVIWIWNQNIAISTIVGTSFLINCPNSTIKSTYVIWNRHSHECSRIWKWSGNFTLIQCIKKCRDFLGRDMSGTTF
jgi:hypothetical protein